MDDKPKAIKWKCKTCGNTVTTYIKLSEPPVCANKKHSTKTVLMEQT